MNNLNPEQQEDVNKRIEVFTNEYKEICERLEVALGTYPKYVPSEIGFTTIIEQGPYDTKYLPKPSPFSKLLKK